MSENERTVALNLRAGDRPALFIKAGTAEEIKAALEEVAAAGLYEAIADAASAFEEAAVPLRGVTLG
jgi:hypothetical protein